MSRWWPASVRRGTTLAAFLACGVILTLGWLGTRAFVETNLTSQATNLARSRVDRLVASLGDGSDRR